MKRMNTKKVRKSSKKRVLHKKMKKSVKKRSSSVRASRKHRRRHTKRSRKGGNLLWYAYGAPPDGVQATHIPNPSMAYVAKGGHGKEVQTFVGEPWGPSISKWPGVSGPHDGNHFSQNPYNVQPEMNPINERVTMKGGNQMPPTNEVVGMKGGKRKRKTRKYRKRGGAGIGLNVIPQLKTDLVNGYKQIVGEEPVPSPLPYKDQIYHGNTSQDNLNFLR